MKKCVVCIVLISFLIVGLLGCSSESNTKLPVGIKSVKVGSVSFVVLKNEAFGDDVKLYLPIDKYLGFYKLLNELVPLFNSRTAPTLEEQQKIVKIANNTDAIDIEKEFYKAQSQFKESDMGNAYSVVTDISSRMTTLINIVYKMDSNTTANGAIPYVGTMYNDDQQQRDEVLGLETWFPSLKLNYPKQ